MPHIVCWSWLISEGLSPGASQPREGVRRSSDQGEGQVWEEEGQGAGGNTSAGGDNKHRAFNRVLGLMTSWNAFRKGKWIWYCVWFGCSIWPLPSWSRSTSDFRWLDQPGCFSFSWMLLDRLMMKRKHAAWLEKISFVYTYFSWFFFVMTLPRWVFFNLFTWSLKVYVFGVFLLFLHFGFRQ